MDAGGWVPKKFAKGFKRELWELAAQRAERDLHAESGVLMQSGGYTDALNELTERHYQWLRYEMDTQGSETQVPTWEEHQALRAQVRTIAQAMLTYFRLVKTMGGLTSGEAFEIMSSLRGVLDATDSAKDDPGTHVEGGGLSTGGMLPPREHLE